MQMLYQITASYFQDDHADALRHDRWKDIDRIPVEHSRLMDAVSRQNCFTMTARLTKSITA